MAKPGESSFIIEIYNLSNKVYDYQFEAGNRFFEQFENSPVTVGEVNCNLVLEKSERMIRARFELKGQVELTCDRSLERFNHPIEAIRSMIFKYGEQEEELDDNMMIIPEHLLKIDMGKYLFEYLVLELPMKKLHPRFEDEDAEEEKLVYSSDTNNDDKNIDPRWEALKKLK
ncbi:MAG: DUF177 domain-containing protein [Cyclobacteriaceae bacterium]|nr:DUF177 domain-containing protein [Cyclobacteriaceae bacterium]